MHSHISVLLILYRNGSIKCDIVLDLALESPTSTDIPRITPPSTVFMQQSSSFPPTAVLVHSAGKSVVYIIFQSIYELYMLTHLPWTKWPPFRRRHFQTHFREWQFYLISIRISLKFVPNGPIYNKAVLVQVKAWRLTGDNPLPEPMLTQFTDAYMRHSTLIVMHICVSESGQHWFR